MNRKVVLDYKKRNEALVDRAEWFRKFESRDKNECFSKMQSGCPIIINIDGSYYSLDSLSKICIYGSKDLDDFIREMKSPTNLPYRLIFIWRK